MNIQQLLTVKVEMIISKVSVHANEEILVKGSSPLVPHLRDEAVPMYDSDYCS